MTSTVGATTWPDDEALARQLTNAYSASETKIRNSSAIRHRPDRSHASTITKTNNTEEPESSNSGAGRPPDELTTRHLVDSAQFAPLASLDCSITEPAISGHDHQQDGVAPGSTRARLSTPTDTPTLSGYFDCDELSDMVDGSLFEITTAGCLSRSVFVEHKQLCGGDNNTNTNHRPTTTTSHSRSSLGPSLGGQRPGEPDGASVVQHHQPAPLGAEHVAPAEPMALVGPVAQIRPYDYSSSSRVPAQTRSAAHQQQPPPVWAGRRPPPRCKSTRPPPAQRPGGFVSSEQQPCAGAKPSGSASAARSRRKARSNPDVRAANDKLCAADNKPAATDPAGALPDNDTNADRTAGARPRAPPAPLSCAICREQAKRRKGKRRFTFSLFNLFTGGSSGAANQEPENSDKICHHRQNPIVGRGPTRRPSASGHAQGEQQRDASASSNSKQLNCSIRQSSSLISRRNHSSSGKPEALPTPKLRDSIRITNQRKNRGGSNRNNLNNNNDDCRPSSLTNNDKSTVQGGELLLDLSRSKCNSNYIKTTIARPTLAQGDFGTSTISQRDDGRPDSNEKVNQPQANTIPISCDGQQAALGGRAGASLVGLGQQQSHQQMRQNKSVKFTTPDKVVILSPSARHSSSTNLPPPAHLQPSAPIIKGPVPKSSSYSQTESNKGLDELLARYDSNKELILEINEKLKLTETIDSNLSTLDNKMELDRCSLDDSSEWRRPVAGLDNEQEPQLIRAQDNGDNASNCACNHQTPFAKGREDLAESAARHKGS